MLVFAGEHQPHQPLLNDLWTFDFGARVRMDPPKRTPVQESQQWMELGLWLDRRFFSSRRNFTPSGALHLVGGLGLLLSVSETFWGYSFFWGGWGLRFAG